MAVGMGKVVRLEDIQEKNYQELLIEEKANKLLFPADPRNAVLFPLPASSSVGAGPMPKVSLLGLGVLVPR